MKTPSIDASQSPIHELPAATRGAQGCLFVSGCGGSLGFMVILFLAAVQIALWVESWVTGKPSRLFGADVQLQPGPLAWIWWLLSWVAYRGIATRNRQPWVYGISVLCLVGWCYIALTKTLVTSDLPGAQITMSWIISALAILICLRFTFSRQNLEYFRVIKSKQGE